MSYKLIALSWNHRNAEVDFRGKLALSNSNILQIYKFSDDCDYILEFSILSTCNRIEFYAISSNLKMVEQWIENQYNLFLKRKIQFNKCKPIILVNRDAVKHIFRVSAGLDSMVIGEKQILDQVRLVYKQILKRNYQTNYLKNLFHKSIECGKIVRNKTELGKIDNSISVEIINYSKKIYPTLDNCSVLVIGAGEIAQLTAQNYIQAGVKNIYLSNRSEENGINIATKMNVFYLPFHQIISTIRDMDIVITATKSMNPIIKFSDINEIIKNNKTQKVLFIDISIPRNIDSKIKILEGISLLDLDSLKSRSLNVMKSNIDLSHSEKLINSFLTLNYKIIFPVNNTVTINNDESFKLVD